jgi:hypothetical protein
MSGIPQSMEVLLLKFWTGQAATALTGPLKQKLVTTASTDTAQGTEVANAGGSAYAEQTVAFGAPTAGTPSTAANSGAVSYTNMPATTVVGVDVHDSAGTPQRALFAALSANKTTGLGDTLSFAAGSIVASLQ